MSDIRVLTVDVSDTSVGELAERLAELRVDGALIQAENAPPGFWPSLLSELRRRGLNWLRIKYVDLDRDARLLSPHNADLLGKALEAYLRAAGETRSPVELRRISKPVSRRDLLRRPLTALTEYSSAPIVLADGCASRYPSCTLCESSCPYGALEGKPPTVDPEKCLECGLCSDACPMTLIRSPQASLEGYYSFLRSLSALAGRATVLAVCPGTRRALYEDMDNRPGWKPPIPLILFETDCYPSLTLYHAALSRLAGLPLIYYCPERLRSRCNRREAVERYRSMLEELEGALDGLPVFAGSLEELSPKPVKPSILPPPLLRGYREALSLLALGKDEWRSLRHAPFFRVEASDKCTLCGVCVNKCPEDALSLSVEEDRYVLRFNHARCTGCGECVEACPEQALTLSRAVNPGLLSRGGVEKIAESPVARCIVCGAPIGPEASIRRVEEELRRIGAPEYVVRSVRICQRCKARRQVEEILRGPGNS